MGGSYGSYGPAKSRQAKHLDRMTAADFREDEGGSILILGLFLFVLMLMVGGMALDFMRFEHRRTLLQQTLDRSVLAATSLTQTLPPEEVVADHFLKAGLADSLDGVYVDDSVDWTNHRIVSANAKTVMPTFLMHLLGFDDLEIKAGSGAEQRVIPVEISIVLDHSGSMRGSRLDALRPAAVEFVRSLLNTAVDDTVSIGLVPYGTTASLGGALFDALGLPRIQNESFCVDSNAASYDTTAFNPLNDRQAPHFDWWRGRGAEVFPRNAQSWNCRDEVGSNTVLPTDNLAVLEAAINALTNWGSTSIEVGVKIGAALLDPSLNPAFQTMANDGDIQAKFSDRPIDPADQTGLKILVVMTDGANATSYHINEPYRQGPSPIYINEKDQKVSVKHYGPLGVWFWASDKSWHRGPEGKLTDYRRMNWQEVWERWTISHVAHWFYYRAFGTSGWVYEFRSVLQQPEKDLRLHAICAAAKAKGVIIYTIGFEAPANGVEVMKDCATSNSHYFNASTLNIGSTFAAIASNITRLRLTH